MELQLTDSGARALWDALAYDRRLRRLSLRANELSAEAEADFVGLMKEHQALLRVDLRQNKEQGMGILKVRGGGGRAGLAGGGNGSHLCACAAVQGGLLCRPGTDWYLSGFVGCTLCALRRPLHVGRGTQPTARTHMRKDPAQSMQSLTCIGLEAQGCPRVQYGAGRAQILYACAIASIQAAHAQHTRLPASPKPGRPTTITPVPI